MKIAIICFSLTGQETGSRLAQGMREAGMSVVFDKKSKYAGLNEVKGSFNSVITEYIGEYDIILNNFKYGIYKNFTKEK